MALNGNMSEPIKSWITQLWVKDFSICLLLILLLVVLLIPKFTQISQEERRFGRAKTVLEQIYGLERKFYKDHHHYKDNLDSLNFIHPGDSYIYSITVASDTFFIATSFPKEGHEDSWGIWAVDQTGKVIQILHPPKLPRGN